MVTFERNLMPKIMIKCPTTMKLVFIGIRAYDRSDYEAMEFSGRPVECPHCNATHAWTKAETILEG